ncbi:helix-turn-helix domain-containing protein [Streptomyces sp. SID8356]|uniref:helix-turn-helix domain-containing protein n=1 Tax=Streptomyces sp. CcalMP-8W TaxID=1155715 RepID=UPI00131A419B|nr:helix-turn-helix domain-containing protein [Streptomyces sp. SID8356]
MRKGTTRADYARLESVVLTDRARISARVQANVPIRRIAEEYGIDRRTLARIVDGWGVPRRPPNRKGHANLSPRKRR